jgi:hypothetical protein
MAECRPPRQQRYRQIQVWDGSDLEAGAQELDDVAVVAGAQDEDLAPEGLRIARLVLARDLIREDLYRHHLYAIAECLVHLWGCENFT